MSDDPANQVDPETADSASPGMAPLLFRITLVLMFMAIGMTRLAVIDRGHFYWTDERCYLPAEVFISELAAGEFRGAMQHLFVAGDGVPPARPTFVLVSTIPVLIQKFTSQFHADPQNPLRAYDAAAAFNVAVTLGMTWCVFALALRWIRDPWLAMAAALVFSLTVGANFWVRHMVPYSESMLLGMAGLLLLSRCLDAETYRTRTVMLAGVLFGLGFSCYPGHYGLVLVGGMVAVLGLRRLVPILAFAIGSAGVLLFWDCAARIAGRSYLRDLTQLSNSITMGDPSEGLMFGWHYLRDVEGVTGILLVVGSLLFVGTMLLRRPGPIALSGKLAILSAMAAYLFHGGMGVFGGSMVYYGRVFIIYLPFAVLATVLMIGWIRRPGLRAAILVVLLGVSISTHVSFMAKYRSVQYPADFLQMAMRAEGRTGAYPIYGLWALGYKGQRATLEARDDELMIVSDTQVNGSSSFVQVASHEQVQLDRPKYLGVNLKFLGYINKNATRFAQPSGYELLAEAEHPEMLMASRFEGRKPWERQRIAQRGYAMRIYRRMATADANSPALTSVKSAPQ